MTNTILPDWFRSDLGHAIMGSEYELFARMVPDQYFQVGLQLGACEWPALEKMNVGVPITVDTQAVTSNCPNLLAEPEALPFAEHSVDLVVMPHGLDFCADPVSSLREINQILVPEGHLVLTGFNRTSLLGCCRLAHKLKPRSKSRAPWNGRFYRVGEIQEWLSLLGLELVAGGMLFYRLPLQHTQWRERLKWMDTIGDRWWPGLGGVYVLVLKKQVYATTAKAHRYKLRRNWLGLLNPAPVNNKTDHAKSNHTH